MLPGGRLTVEDAYAYAKFARVALGTNDIDFRARPLSAEETRLPRRARRRRDARDVVLRRRSKRRRRCCSSASSRRRSPRSSSCGCARPRAHGAAQGLVASRRSPSRGLDKLDGTAACRRVPGGEADALASLDADGRRRALRGDGALILVGERLATSPGALSAAAALADRTGARLAWVPRRAGERGAVDAGACPPCCPAASGRRRRGRAPRSSAVWGADRCPTRPAATPTAILQAAAEGALAALVVGGVDPADLADPALAAEALDARRLRGQPGGAAQRGHRARRRGAPGRAGGREGRPLRQLGRPAPPVRPDDHGHRRDDRRPGARRARRRARRRPRAAAPSRPRAPSCCARRGRHRAPRSGRRRGCRGHAGARRGACSPPGTSCIDAGSLQDGDDHLAGTAKPRARPGSRRRPPPSSASPTATGHGQHRARRDHAAGRASSDMPDGVVWLPTNAPRLAVRRTLRRRRRRDGQADSGRCASRSSSVDGAQTVMATHRVLAAQNLPGFGDQPVWLVLIKVVARLRVPGRHDAVRDRVRAQGRRPDAEPHRPEPGRPVGHRCSRWPTA